MPQIQHFYILNASLDDAAVGSNGNLGTWRAIGLDLNGDGIQTVSEQSSGVVFDVDGTGFAKQTAWVAKQDVRASANDMKFKKIA